MACIGEEKSHLRHPTSFLGEACPAGGPGSAGLALWRPRVVYAESPGSLVCFQPWSSLALLAGPVLAYGPSPGLLLGVPCGARARASTALARPGPAFLKPQGGARTMLRTTG